MTARRFILRALPPRHRNHRLYRGSHWRNAAHFDVGYLVGVNTSGQGASTPDSAAYDVLTGDLQIIVGVAFNHVTSKATIDNIITKGDPSAAGVGSFVFRKAASVRTIQFSWREAGGTVRTINFLSAAPNVVDQFRWYKLEFTASTATGDLYISSDIPETPISSISWALHASDTDAVSTNIAIGSADIWLGNRHGNPNEWLDGKLYYAEVRNGINGTVVLNPDFRYRTDLP